MQGIQVMGGVHLMPGNCPRRTIDAEAPAQTLRESVSASDGIAEGTPPSFDSAALGGLLLVRAAQVHPIAVRLEHVVQVFDAARIVMEDGLAHSADDNGQVVALAIQMHGGIRRARRRFEWQWIVLGSVACGHGCRWFQAAVATGLRRDAVEVAERADAHLAIAWDRGAC